MGGAVFTPEQKSWRFYDNDNAEPSNPKADQDTAPTLSASDEVCRLRVVVAETGGKGVNNIAIDLQYKYNGTWYDFGPSAHFDYYNGLATEGDLVTSNKITPDGTHYGEYSESAGGSGTYDINASEAPEFDICFQPTGNALPNTAYTFQVLIDSTEVPLGSGESYPQLTTASGPTDYPVNLSVGLNISDSVSRAIDWDRSLSSGLSMAITVDRDIDWSRALSEGLTISHTVGVAKAFARSLSKTLNISHSVSRALAFGRAVSKAINLSKTIIADFSGWITEFSAILSVGLTMAPSVSRALAFGRSVSKSLSLSESISNAKAFGRSLSKSLSLSKTVTTARAFGRSVSKNLSISKTISRAIAWSRAVSENLNIAKSVIANFSGGITEFFATLSLNLSLTTTVDRVIAFKRALSKNLKLAVTAIGYRNYLAVVSKTLSVSISILNTLHIRLRRTCRVLRRYHNLGYSLKQYTLGKIYKKHNLGQ